MKKSLPIEQMSLLSQLYHNNLPMSEEEENLYYTVVKNWEETYNSIDDDDSYLDEYPSLELLENSDLLEQIDI